MVANARSWQRGSQLYIDRQSNAINLKKKTCFLLLNLIKNLTGPRKNEKSVLILLKEQQNSNQIFQHIRKVESKKMFTSKHKNQETKKLSFNKT